ncbi:MAG TPA: pyridoxamine 5'-phosphate oxidase [Planctomycetota bacterium]
MPNLPEPLPETPLALFGAWLAESRAAGLQPNPDAMALATADLDGEPSVRMVLCRGFDAEAGALVFYTNRKSRKGVELAARPRAEGVFHWDAMGRQVRIAGPVVRSPDAESDAYFAQRPRLAQISAWASAQSEPVASIAAMHERMAVAEARFGATEGPPVPRPPHWGGYRIGIERAELWISGEGRVHDRAVWTRPLEVQGSGFFGGAWSASRLQP